jgi:hypothetical protein
MIDIPPLSSGLHYIMDDEGKSVCLGAHLGRPDKIPNRKASPKLSLRRLRAVNQDYDSGGAYWGTASNVWRAVGEGFEIFVRAHSRPEARNAVRIKVAGARFYR